MKLLTFLARRFAWEGFERTLPDAPEEVPSGSAEEAVVAFVHLEAIDVDVNIFGMTVRPGDLIHADRHGAVVIPTEAAPHLPAAIDTLTRREAVILEACRQPGFSVETLKQAMADADEIH